MPITYLIEVIPPLLDLFAGRPTRKSTRRSVRIVAPEESSTMDLSTSTQLPISIQTDSKHYLKERTWDVLQSPHGTVLYSQGHDWNQLQNRGAGIPLSPNSQLGSPLPYPADSALQLPYPMSPGNYSEAYRVQSPGSSSYPQHSPDAQMQAIFVRTTTTTHRRTTLSPRTDYTLV
ncbi:unnamed protein product, partial [Mesorhabditis spiculigera]